VIEEDAFVYHSGEANEKPSEKMNPSESARLGQNQSQAQQQHPPLLTDQVAEALNFAKPAAANNAINEEDVRIAFGDIVLLKVDRRASKRGKIICV
jgi:hypothetical protein